jgi:cytochrome c peroxidase
MSSETGGIRPRGVLCAAAIAGALVLGGTATADERDEMDKTIDAIERLMRGMGGGLPDAPTDDDYAPRDKRKEKLGRLLFHDKILSGNRNISCATCHHVLADTGDGLSLPIGEGAQGLGVTRNTGSGSDAVHERVPRNAPPVFNLGALEFEVIFHDGRIMVDPSQPSGFLNPAGDDLPLGLDSALAAQAMFPVTSATEMAGQEGENEIANAAARGDLAGPEGVWELIAQRLRAIPEYVTLFQDAFNEIGSADQIEYKHAANAIAAFEAFAFRADQSPFDRYLRGEQAALSRSARRGMNLFYGSAGCADCHSGAFQTNHGFAAIAMPQVGPGKGDNQRGYDDGRDDFGRERVTGLYEDRFRFRVPTLRNVALTGPWGHGGAYGTLEAVIRHHMDPVGSLHSYDPSQCLMPSRSDLDAQDFVVQQDAKRRAGIAKANELSGISLSDEDIVELVDFLHALTDPRMNDLRAVQPLEVPSGLPIFD